MAGKYTEAQAKAIRKYQSKTVCIQIRVPEEKRDRYKELADDAGKSLSAYIIDVMDKQMPKRSCMVMYEEYRSGKPQGITRSCQITMEEATKLYESLAKEVWCGWAEILKDGETIKRFDHKETAKAMTALFG